MYKTTKNLEDLKRKRDQQYELAGLAMRDKDPKAAGEHYDAAREYERQIKEAM